MILPLLREILFIKNVLLFHVVGTVHQQTGLTVSAPSGVNVQSNADRSITMSFGLDNAASKENQPPMNVAPPPNMFKVNKVETSSSTTTTWKPKASGSAFTPTAFNYENQQAVAETNKVIFCSRSEVF